MSEELGLDSGDEVKINLKSSDGKSFPVNRDAAISQSEFIKSALDDDNSAADIELRHIESDIAERIVSYIEYHSKTPAKEIKQPLVSANLADVVDEFDANFADVDQDTMFKTLLAANYMHITSLLNLMCAKVASLMKDKSPEKIRETFGISNDYTKEDEEKIRNDYKKLLE